MSPDHGAAPTIPDLLAALASEPADEQLRARAAEALTAAGRDREAIELLGVLVNLTAHDGPTLPCLCRRCLVAEQVTAAAEGMSFVRRFVVGRGRVLYFWVPEEISDSPGLLRGVRERMLARLDRPPKSPPRGGGGGGGGGGEEDEDEEDDDAWED